MSQGLHKGSNFSGGAYVFKVYAQCLPWADIGVSPSDLYLVVYFVCDGGTKTTQCSKVLGVVLSGI